MSAVAWLLAVAALACPADMVPTGVDSSCIDREPLPLLGLSAVPNNYLDLRGETWDAETICAMHGKRLPTWEEWKSACHGTMSLPLVNYIAPDWSKVERHDPFELFRLDQRPSLLDHPEVTGWSGARGMTTRQEWVRFGKGYAFSRGFWSREGGCDSITVGHDPRWWDYATSARGACDLVVLPSGDAEASPTYAPCDRASR